MYCNIRVTRNIDDLHKNVWEFWFHESRETIYLRSFCVMERESRRHKFQVKDSYSLDGSRKNTIGLERVPLPKDVADEALKQFVSGITVKPCD